MKGYMIVYSFHSEVADSRVFLNHDKAKEVEEKEFYKYDTYIMTVDIIE